MIAQRRKVHQIWLGGTIPPTERQWTRSIEGAASCLGWEYRLWTWRDGIEDSFGKERPFQLFSKAEELLPDPRTYVLASRYYRYRILAEHGGTYLDTDVHLEYGCLPSLPVRADVYSLPGNKPDILVCHDREAMRIACRLAGEELEKFLGDLDTDSGKLQFLQRMQALTKPADYPLGARFLQETVLPAWEDADMELQELSSPIVGDKEAALRHAGRNGWLSEQPDWHTLLTPFLRDRRKPVLQIVLRTTGQQDAVVPDTLPFQADCSVMSGPIKELLGELRDKGWLFIQQPDARVDYDALLSFIETMPSHLPCVGGLTASANGRDKLRTDCLLLSRIAVKRLRACPALTEKEVSLRPALRKIHARFHPFPEGILL